MNEDFITLRRWLHPKCTPLSVPAGMLGPFVDLGDGRVMTMAGEGGLAISDDDGVTWSEPRVPDDASNLPSDPRSHIPSANGGLLLRTRNDTLILVYTDHATFKWGWIDETSEPIANVRGDVWTMRSLDGGKTWIDREQLLDGYCGGMIDIIETRDGDVVVPIQQLLYNPGRHTTSTCVSADQGATWTRSNIIDLGGHGHHDGGDEGTLAELSDGRLLMLMRTSWDLLWEAFSDDGGRSWRTFRPSALDASSAPGYLVGLTSGRIALVWNRLYPHGRNYHTRRGMEASTVAASNHREELSIAFSEDDGASWLEPQVFAVDRDTRVSYPMVFEHRAGELWITTRHQGGLQLRLLEDDFV
ncbi:MAG: sialidase family protein [Candidatus Latescibacterota bacterium]|nr:sialidase family protein [Candidatus Latescibacterota bacterium]